jgi:hypothetical protein
MILFLKFDESANPWLQARPVYALLFILACRHCSKLAVVAVCIATVISGASAQTNAQPTRGRGLRGTYAPIRAGKITVLSDAKHQQDFGVGDEVEFRKLNSSPSDYMDAIRGRVGAGDITFVHVSDTLYSFILLNGAVQPLILEAETWEVWEMTGLGRYFQKCRSVYPGQRQIAFGGVEGTADVWPVWHFEFGDKQHGPRVRFTLDGGW